MPRLLGVEIPGDKRIDASLPYIYGIGPSTAKKILEQAEKAMREELEGAGNNQRDAGWDNESLREAVQKRSAKQD